MYSKMINKALRIAAKAHEGQVDKAGLPYILHPVIVASCMENEDETITAVLHDVVEDTDISIDYLRAEGFSEQILDALKLLTHDKEIPYMEYIERISQNRIAKNVKLSDLANNSAEGRLDEQSEEDNKRNEKYLKAIKYLLSV